MQARIESVEIDRFRVVQDVRHSQMLRIKIGIRAVAVHDEYVARAKGDELAIYIRSSRAVGNDRDFGEIVHMTRVITVLSPSRNIQREILVLKIAFLTQSDDGVHYNTGYC